MGDYDDTQMTTAEIRQKTSGDTANDARSPSKGMPFGFSICKVLRIDYVTHEAHLQVLTGEDQTFPRTPIPVAYPGAGPRSFLGHIPTIGSICICGYLATTPRVPVIVGWLLGGALAGMEWIPTQKFLPTEVNFTPKLKAEVEGLFNRQRHKLNHARPGMIMASSAMGSDMILDEGVFLSNRRANEIRLRDQDQAFVVRSLQQFHAMGGARIYGGMVQRDGTLLQAAMVSDGIQWDAAQQLDDSGAPLPALSLAVDPSRPEGVLTPHDIFYRSNPGTGGPDSKFSVEARLDPYNFLKNGLFIGSDGTVINSSQTTSAGEYGGKPLYRVSLPSPNVENAAVDKEGAETLTEYRIELDHIWDGTLPVTEQTDGFDADRLPSEAGDSDNPLSQGSPFIEWVLGSVVGNNHSSESGRREYGVPLTPIIFDGEEVNPRLDAAIGVDLNEHAATLFRLTPPLRTNDAPSFFSFTKDGRFRASIGGPPSENSAEIALAGGLKFSAGGKIAFGGSALALNVRDGDPLDNYAFQVNSASGAIKLSAGGPTTEGSFPSRTNPDVISEGTLPALLLEAKGGNVHAEAGRILKLVGNSAIQLTDTNEVTATPTQSFNVYSSKFLCNVTTLDRTVLGQEQTMYSGPKNFLPTNLPLRSVKFTGTPLTGHIGGKTDEYSMLLGNREEEIKLGNHETSVLVGNQTYKVGLGTITLQAGLATPIPLQSKITMTAASITGSTAGSYQMSSKVSSTLKSDGIASLTATGMARVQGATVFLNASAGNPPITPAGAGIVSGADIDPTSGKKFSFFGVGSTTHRLGIKTV